MQLDRRRADTDRRQTERAVAVFAVKAVIGKRVQLAQCEDLTPEGMSLRRPRGLALRSETPISLTFDVPDDGEAVTALGVVVSDVLTGPFRRTGVRFTVIHPRHRSVIEAFCARGGAGSDWQSSASAP